MFEGYYHWHCCHITFLGIYNFSKCRNNGNAKYGRLLLPGAFPDKLIPIVDSTDEAVVQSDVSKVFSFIKKRDSNTGVLQ